MRTFSRETWSDAQAAWDDGEFSVEWREVRHTMAMQGCLYPPNGSKWDSFEDSQPSQRAVLIRAIRETPDLLAKVMRGASTWQQVIERLFRERDELRLEVRRRLDDEEREVDRRRMQPIGDIVRSFMDSVGMDR